MTAVINNRTRPRQDLRDAIYRAAISLFAERGYSNVSVDEIVAAANVAKGTFYNFFPSKAHVLKAYYAAIDIEIAALRRAADHVALRRSLARYAADVERILRREGRLMTDLLREISTDPAMQALDQDSGSLDEEEFADLFRAAAHAGEVRDDIDAKMAAAALMDLWAGAIRAWMQGGQAESLALLFNARASLLFEGLKP